MKISKFQQLMNFFRNNFNLTSTSKMETFLSSPVYDKVSNFSVTNTQKELPIIQEVQDNRIEKEPILPEDIALNKKISNHIYNLFKTIKYDEIQDILNSIPENKISDIFFSDTGKANNIEFSNKILFKTLDVFSNSNIIQEEKDIVDFINFIKHPLFNKILSEALNNEYQNYHKDYKRSLILDPFIRKIEHNEVFFSKITNKLFSIDFTNKEYVYQGLDVLNSFEKKFIEVAFENIKYNLSEKKSDQYLYLFTDSFTLLAFLHENPEFQTSNILYEENDKLSKHFSNYNSAIQIIRRKCRHKKDSSEAMNSIFNQENSFNVGDNLYNIALDKLTKLPSIMAEHDNLLNQLSKTYGNNFLNTIDNSSIPEELSKKIKNKYFELEEWKNSFFSETDIETTSFINNTQKSLLNIISIYEQVQDISPETNTATSLIEHVLSTIEDQILSHSEQNLNSIISNKKLTKKLM